MNEQAREELERLKQRQNQLQEQLGRLGAEIKAFETRLREQPAPAPVAPARPPIVTPPPIPAFAKVAPAPTPTPVPVAAATPAPPVITPSPASAPKPEPVLAERASFEMRLGTYWLVRIGMVMLLTAFVFFGYYAYEHYVPLLGPAAKLAMLYAASGVLLAVGGWCWWRGKETLRNYGQVMFAGGLAAVYFTTYAAHYLPAVRVIESPLVDGILLLAWATLITGLAHRWKSEVLALFAVGLAYYTSAITTVGLFTLYSNLLLTAAAVFFLLRNRWARVSYLSLAATYASFFFWSYIYRNGFSAHKVLEHFWTGNLFVFSYWLLFTAAALLSRHGQLSDRARAVFITSNNGAFFGLVTVALMVAHRDWFWVFALGFGFVLCVLTFICNRAFAASRNSYLAQGLVLVTVGLIAKFSGLQLALLLAAQSVILLVLGSLQQSRIMRGASHVVAALAVLFGSVSIDDGQLLLGISLGCLLAFNSAWSRHRQGTGELIQPSAIYFACLSVLIWLLTTIEFAPRNLLAPVLAGEALLLTATIYFIRVREISVAGQSLFLMALAFWLFQSWIGLPRPWWAGPCIMTIALALLHWWQWQKALPCDDVTRRVCEGFFALSLATVAYTWIEPRLSSPQWLAASGGLALILTVYGVATRSWTLAVVAQIFAATAVSEFVVQHLEGRPGWSFSLAPIVTLMLLSSLPGLFSHQENERVQTLRYIAGVYRWTAVLLTLGWVHDYIPARERFWVFAAISAVVFVWAGWRRSTESLIVSAAFLLAGLSCFWFPVHGQSTVYLPNLAAILVLLAQQQIARRDAERYRLPQAVHTAIIVIGGLSLWIFSTRWVLSEAGGFYLTVSWSAMALLLFLGGLAIRERAYRWLGLGILACALGRVMIVDIWRLEVIYRVASFAALGVVLLLLGFLYNKYLEKIRQWL